MKHPGLCLFLLLAWGCSDRDLRGEAVPSPDGKTYLVVEENKYEGCSPLKVDGVVWATELHEPGPIAPGAHELSCGDDGKKIGFIVEAGTTFHFDYWGP